MPNAKREKHCYLCEQSEVFRLSFLSVHNASGIFVAGMGTLK